MLANRYLTTLLLVLIACCFVFPAGAAAPGPAGKGSHREDPRYLIFLPAGTGGAEGTVPSNLAAGALRAAGGRLLSPGTVAAVDSLREITLAVKRLHPLTGEVVVLQGRVAISSSKGEDRPRVVTGKAAFRPGDRITTGSGGIARLQFADGSCIRLEGNTELAVKAGRGRLFFRPGGTPGCAVSRLVLELKEGSLYGVAGPRYKQDNRRQELGPRFEIRTPAGVLSTGGAVWQVTAAGKVAAAVLAEEATFARRNDVINIKPGEEITVTALVATKQSISNYGQYRWAAQKDWILAAAREIDKLLPCVYPAMEGEAAWEKEVERAFRDLLKSSDRENEGETSGDQGNVPGDDEGTEPGDKGEVPGDGDEGSTEPEGDPPPGTNQVQLSPRAEGDTVTVPVEITNADGVYAFDLRVAYNPEVLELQEVRVNTAEFPLVAKEEAREPGEVWLAASRRGDTPELAGSATLATITFTRQAAGDLGLAVTVVTLCNKEAELLN